METDFTVFDWERLFLGDPPKLYMLEMPLKALIIFLLLMLVVRLMGKRGQRDLSPMQQMLLIALGSAAGDAMLYPMVPLAYAAIILVGVTLLTVGLEWWAERSSHVRDYMESRPRVLVRDGEVDYDALRKERTTLRELLAELRMKGASAMSQVDVAILEVTGDVSVFLNDSKPAKKDLIEYVLEENNPSPPDYGDSTTLRQSSSFSSKIS